MKRERKQRTCKVKFGSWLMAIAVLTTLGSCNNDEINSETLEDGKYPMTFTATVDGMTQARATTANTWDGNEKVVMQIGNEVKEYIAATNGTLTANAGVTPWYWTSSTEIKTVSAWHSTTYSATKPISFSVETNQGAATSYQQSDMIYAAATISYGNPALTFRHLPAKVVVNLKAGEGVTATDVQGATVSLVNQHLTSGTIAADWSVAQQTASSSNTITPAVATTAGGFDKSVQALVVPQQTTTAGRFISITIGGQEFVYSTVLNLAAGTQHTYDITVAKTGITVMASGAEPWGVGSTTNVTSKELVAGYAASDLKLGDYYYSDGAWSDGGYRKYADNTTATLFIMPMLKDAGGKARTVVGIVYWVGDITKDDPLLKAKHSGCTHGLVVALQDISASTIKWSTSSETVNAWTNHADRGADKVNITVENKMQGYSNTQALTAYNAQQNNTDLKVLPIAAIAQYTTDHPTPTNSSGWYFPSVMELKYMCRGQGCSSGTSGKTMLETQFWKVGGASFFQPFYYWSSSEFPDYYGYRARDMDFFYGNVDDGRKYDGRYVRSILAF